MELEIENAIAWSEAIFGHVIFAKNHFLLIHESLAMNSLQHRHHKQLFYSIKNLILFSRLKISRHLNNVNVIAGS